MRGYGQLGERLPFVDQQMPHPYDRDFGHSRTAKAIQGASSMSLMKTEIAVLALTPQRD
jgi:hypothetical protein